MTDRDVWTPWPAPAVRAGGHIGAFVGDRLLLVAFGDATTGSLEAAILDGTTWRWSTIPTPLQATDSDAGFAAMRDTVAVTGYGWALETHSRLRLRIQPCPAAGGARTGRYLVGVYGAYDAVANRCLALPPAPPRPEPVGANGSRGGGLWTGSELLTWSGLTGLDGEWAPNDGAIFRPAAGADRGR